MTEIVNWDEKNHSIGFSTVEKERLFVYPLMFCAWA